MKFIVLQLAGPSGLMLITEVNRLAFITITKPDGFSIITEVKANSINYNNNTNSNTRIINDLSHSSAG